MSPAIPLKRRVITLVVPWREGVTAPWSEVMRGVSPRSHQTQHSQEDGSHRVGCPGPCCCHSTTKGQHSVGQHLSLPEPPSPEGRGEVIILALSQANRSPFSQACTSFQPRLASTLQPQVREYPPHAASIVV